jgi:hypothetical protein
VTRSERIFRALLHAYPKPTRDASGDDMVQLFIDRLRDAQTGRERVAIWLASIADIAVTAPRERLERRRVLRVAAGPAIDARRSVLPDFGVASVPLALTAIVMVAAPGFYSPLFDERVQLAGVPAGTGLLWVTAVLAAIGILAARRRDDLRDPMFQTVLIASLVAPIVLAFVVVPAEGLVHLAWALTLFVLVARFRVVQVALTLPFVAWLLAGPGFIAALLAQKT